MSSTGTDQQRDEQLRTEADYIHRMLFASLAPPIIAERYAAAHQHYCREESSPLPFSVIIDHRLDLEAIEFATRHRDRGVTRKIQIVLYLTEARSEYQPFFVNDQKRVVHAWMKLAFLTFRSVYKLLKGKLLLHRYGDVR